MRFLIALLLMILPLPVLAGTVMDETWHDAARARDVPVKIRRPDGAGPFPVLLFSHGLGGSRENYAYWGEGLVAAGYAVIHLQHPGSDTETLKNGGLGGLKRAANLENSKLRAGDVAFAAAQVRGGAARLRLDHTRIGLAGHSFGGNTTLISSGQTILGRSHAVPAIRCGMPISAPSPAVSRALNGINRPLLIVTGTEDTSMIGDDTPESRIGVYRAISAPGQGLVVFDGADHMVFSGRQRRGGARAQDAAIQQATVKLARLWFGACLNGRPLPSVAALQSVLPPATARIERK